MEPCTAVPKQRQKAPEEKVDAVLNITGLEQSHQSVDGLHPEPASLAFACAWRLSKRCAPKRVSTRNVAAGTHTV